MTDHYSTLGVPATATEDEIRKSYRKLCLKYHPDKTCDPASHRLFLEIQASYDILSLPQKKAQYDATRVPSPSRPLLRTTVPTGFPTYDRAPDHRRYSYFAYQQTRGNHDNLYRRAQEERQRQEAERFKREQVQRAHNEEMLRRRQKAQQEYLLKKAREDALHQQAQQARQAHLERKKRQEKEEQERMERELMESQQQEEADRQTMNGLNEKEDFTNENEPTSKILETDPSIEETAFGDKIEGTNEPPQQDDIARQDTVHVEENGSDQKATTDAIPETFDIFKFRLDLEKRRRIVTERLGGDIPMHDNLNESERPKPNQSTRPLQSEADLPPKDEAPRPHRTSKEPRIRLRSINDPIEEPAYATRPAPLNQHVEFAGVSESSGATNATLGPSIVLPRQRPVAGSHLRTPKPLQRTVSDDKSRQPIVEALHRRILQQNQQAPKSRVEMQSAHTSDGADKRQTSASLFGSKAKASCVSLDIEIDGIPNHPLHPLSPRNGEDKRPRSELAQTPPCKQTKARKVVTDNYTPTPIFPTPIVDDVADRRESLYSIIDAPPGVRPRSPPKSRRPVLPTRAQRLNPNDVSPLRTAVPSNINGSKRKKTRDDLFRLGGIFSSLGPSLDTIEYADVLETLPKSDEAKPPVARRMRPEPFVYLDGTSRAETLYTPVNKDTVRSHAIVLSASNDSLMAPRPPSPTLEVSEIREKHLAYVKEILRFRKRVFEYRRQMIQSRYNQVQNASQYQNVTPAQPDLFQEYQNSLATEIEAQKHYLDQLQEYSTALLTYKTHCQWFDAFQQRCNKR